MRGGPARSRLQAGGEWAEYRALVVGQMSEEEKLARSYRLRGEELRTLADLDRNRRTREMLLEVASDYERMAQSLDGIDRTNRVVSRLSSY